MVETIESFVAKLQAEGVEAGQQAADKLLAEAKQQAEQIIQDAKQQAEKLIADADTKAENLLARSQSELELAARDVVLRLRAALGQAMQAILTAKVKEKLAESDFLAGTLHDLIMAYAKSDVESKESIRINVSPELQNQLADWAIKEMAEKAGKAGTTIDLRGTLAAVGFEYNVSGATVEVTLDSVVESISELVTPRLREVIDKAVGESHSSADEKDSQDHDSSNKSQ